MVVVRPLRSSQRGPTRCDVFVAASRGQIVWLYAVFGDRPVSGGDRAGPATPAAWWEPSRKIS